MGMFGTLAKVAVGMAIAKGVGSVMSNKSQNANGEEGEEQQGGGIGDMLGQLTGGNGSGGLGDMLGQLTGGQGADGQQGGLGDIIGQFTGGQGAEGEQAGGLGGMLGQLAGQLTGGQSGGLGGMLDQFTSGESGGAAGQLGDVFGQFLGNGENEAKEETASFGSLFNEAIVNGGETEHQPTREQEAVAALMLRAMIQAAKADGEIDDAERAKIVENLGDLSDEDRAFLEEEIQRPVNIDELASEVPAGMEKQVYLMSLMGINLDHRSEAEYLHELATAMGIEKDDVNAIHDQLGAVQLYS